MDSKKFETHKQAITDAINLKLSAMDLQDPEGFILIQGFINLPIQGSTNSFSIGPKSIPTVVIIGKSTGLVHTFALKILLPGVEL